MSGKNVVLELDFSVNFDVIKAGFMSDEVLEHIVYSKNVIEFVTVANEYCTFVENHAAMSRADFLGKMQKIFPLVYLKATLLPEIDDSNLEAPEKFVDEVEYNFLLNKISEKLGQFDSYQEVFDDGMQFSEEAIGASIADNVCDIYQDLKDFLLAFRIGTTEIMIDALWECQNNFKNYWGQKLVNGLRAMIYADFDLNEEQNDQMGRKKNNEQGENRKGWIDRHFNNFSEED